MNKAHEFLEKAIIPDNIDGDVVENVSINDCYTALAIHLHTFIEELLQYVAEENQYLRTKLIEEKNKIETKYKFLKNK
jgi:hypothetical protein